jgi:6-phosphofructokinase
MVLLGEEVATQKMTLFDITKQICDVIQARSEDGKNHGVILLPEGLIENIPEIHALLQVLYLNVSILIYAIMFCEQCFGTSLHTCAMLFAGNQ